MEKLTIATNLTFKERQRQISKEGWAIGHDDGHTNCELTIAAYCYECEPSERDLPGGDIDMKTAVPIDFPWTDEWWKPTPDDRKKELIKAGALYRAEIERLFRRLEKVHNKLSELI